MNIATRFVDSVKKVFKPSEDSMALSTEQIKLQRAHDTLDKANAALTEVMKREPAATFAEQQAAVHALHEANLTALNARDDYEKSGKRK